ncbi:hypothetical protein PF001_g8908 [Phytophthora fragariae]|uniref:Uncharacterized protein n=2 Tax=Phytophthora fragariae TaxID=53985 RepID=A0A6A4DY87_9STRA|nr:hypothetical protein PF001_g8908 [Phytophthora fragariae]KAE9337914.1 hypothetical protein PF008_g12309 [Phytophthora fragariae]
MWTNEYPLFPMRKQWSLQTGYSNLFDPVIKRHPDFVATVLASVTNNATLVGFIDHKSQTVFCWIDWTTTCNLPFSWCEDGTVTKYTTLARISTEALLKYATLVVREIEIFIGLVIPVKIGIMLDGCTFKSEHVLAVFAVFEPDRRVDKVLLAFAPLIYDDATDHTAASPVKFLKGILPYFNRDVTDIIYLVGDNCTVNRKGADLLEVPLVVYASHGLNLTAQLFMADHASQLDKLQSGAQVAKPQPSGKALVSFVLIGSNS